MTNYYVVNKELCLLRENNIIKFYNLINDTVIDAISISNTKLISFFLSLNYPQSVKSNPLLKQFISSTLFKKKLGKYFTNYSTTILKKENHFYKLLYNFTSNFNQAFELTEGGLLCLVKKAILFTKVYLVDAENSLIIDGLNIKSISIDEAIELALKHLHTESFRYELYIIVPNSSHKSKLKKLEAIFSTNRVTRVYVQENRSYLKIGPCLVGNDYGCFFCRENYLDNSNPSLDNNLLNALLSEEIPKLFPLLLESTIKNYTISGGKIFKLYKFNLSAEEEEFLNNQKSSIHKLK